MFNQLVICIRTRTKTQHFFKTSTWNYVRTQNGWMDATQRQQQRLAYILAHLKWKMKAKRLACHMFSEPEAVFMNRQLRGASENLHQIRCSQDPISSLCPHCITIGWSHLSGPQDIFINAGCRLSSSILNCSESFSSDWSSCCVHWNAQPSWWNCYQSASLHEC